MPKIKNAALALRRFPRFLLVFSLCAFFGSATTVSAQVPPPSNPLPNVPTPESVLGHRPGADFYLANYDESRECSRKLAASSKRIRLISVGKTTRGLDWEIAIISSPENLASLEKYKGLARKLADGRGVSREEARELARQGKDM